MGGDGGVDFGRGGGDVAERVWEVMTVIMMSTILFLGLAQIGVLFISEEVEVAVR